MLKDSHWIEIGETVFELRSKEDNYIATLSYNECEECWALENDNYFEWIGADDAFIAQDSAISSLDEYYNGMVEN